MKFRTRLFSGALFVVLFGSGCTPGDSDSSSKVQKAVSGLPAAYGEKLVRCGNPPDMSNRWQGDYYYLFRFQPGQYRAVKQVFLTVEIGWDILSFTTPARLTYTIDKLTLSKSNQESTLDLRLIEGPKRHPWIDTDRIPVKLIVTDSSDGSTVVTSRQTSWTD